MILGFMAEDGVTMEMFESKSMETGCAHGAYRHITAQAKDIEWDTVRFADKDQDLLNPNYITEGEKVIAEPDTDDEGEVYKALRIKFSLPSSSYATIFMRELTHKD
jgi:tRNA pseudouridine13 synthase